jgi:hypothetical protein
VNAVETMVYRLVGDATSYISMLQQAKSQTQEAAKAVQDHGAKIEGVKNQLMGYGQQLIGVFGSVGLSFGLISSAIKGVQLSAEAEQLEISFKTMLKSAEQGTKMLDSLRKYAAETPFELP